ncbi:hypothetical protein DSCO28_30240 [Desulfosarcina ovata subsp. sediminis]|uniref:Uncharacterized protein n=1 Tax=Desulfosarcina ovata subsp. sediminis TaxID=885957 RepID=A0A5K7ZJP7_9BACT|nr:hypothetical protein DSCO28_30240 [Desulfosarcina ovata subsp. sediminis]
MNPACELFAEKVGLMAEAERMELSGKRDTAYFQLSVFRIWSAVMVIAMKNEVGRAKLMALPTSWGV